MYKLIVLSAVIAVATGVAIPVLSPLNLGLGLGPVSVLNSPAGAVTNVVANQALTGNTGLNAALNTAAVSGPLAAATLLNANAPLATANAINLNAAILAGAGRGLILG